MNPVSKQMGLNTVVEAMAEYLKKNGKSILVGGPVIPERALMKLNEACGFPVARMPLAKGLVFEYHENLIALCAEIMQLAGACLTGEPIFSNYDGSVGYSILPKKKGVIVRTEQVSAANGFVFGCILMQELLLALAKRIKRYTTTYKNYHQNLLTDSQPDKQPLRVNVEMQKLLSGDTAVILGFGYEIQMHGSIKWYAIHKRMIACSSGNGKFQVTAQNVSTRLCCWQNITIFLVKNENLMSKQLMKAAAGVRKRARRSGGGEGPWKRIRRSCGRLLPEELIIWEILPKLPVKSMMRFKSVCKSWQSIISGGDRHLIRSHLQGSRQQLRVLVAPSNRVVSGIVSCHFVQDNCVSKFLLGMPHLKDADCACRPSHCDGLVLFSSSTKFSYESTSGTRLHVCNPATREVATLPSSNNINNPSRVKPRILPNNAVALGVDPLTNKYKVVRIFYRSSDLGTRTCSLGVEVLTLGSRSLCWIPGQHDPPYPIWPCYHASTAEGVIYWLVDNALHRSSPRAIISFSLEDGKFGVIPPPPTWAERDLEPFYKEASLSVLDGDLCCSHSCGPVRHVSVYRKGAWHISHSQPLDDHPLGRASDGRMLVYDHDNHSFGYCDPGEHTTELIPGSTDKWPTYSEEGEPWFYVHIVPYCESLVPIFTENSVLGMNAL